MSTNVDVDAPATALSADAAPRPTTSNVGAVRRGIVACIAASATVVAGAVAASWLSGGPHRYLLVVLGIAAGGAMATQVKRRCNRAGVAALVITAAMTAVTIPAVVIGDRAADAGIGYIDALRSTTDVATLYGDFFDGGPWRAALAVVVAIVVAFVLGKGLDRDKA